MTSCARLSSLEMLGPMFASVGALAAGGYFELLPAGPVEIGLNLDRAASADVSQNQFDPQLKWVGGSAVEGLAWGLAWSALPDLSSCGDSRRAGLSLEWAVAARATSA
jgi:hypothetical protein